MSEEIRHPEVVVGALIYNDKGEILLVKNPKWGDYWVIPGGHIELNETAEEAVKREVKEETGLGLKNIEFARYLDAINPIEFHTAKHFIGLQYFAEMAGGEITKSDEMTDNIWIDPERTDDLKIFSRNRDLIDIYIEKKINKESWEHKYKRALADYHNLLKQTTRDREEFVKYAVGDFLQDILPVYDHLKMSLAGLSEEENSNAWVQGVKHVLKQFKDILEARGIEEIKTVGEKFDHNTMDAIDGAGEKVKQEVRPGYKLNGKVIRPAKVIVE